MSKNLYLGVMTGNSLDHVDIALVDFTSGNTKIKHTYSKKIEQNIKNMILYNLKMS